MKEFEHLSFSFHDPEREHVCLVWKLLG